MPGPTNVIAPLNRERELGMYTVYRAPADVPGAEFAVREWIIGRGPAPVASWVRAASTLFAARSLVPAWASRCMPRVADDDPAIVETWL
jgi:hypothetical protein